MMLFPQVGSWKFRVSADDPGQMLSSTVASLHEVIYALIAHPPVFPFVMDITRSTYSIQ